MERFFGLVFVEPHHQLWHFHQSLWFVPSRPLRSSTSTLHASAKSVSEFVIKN